VARAVPNAAVGPIANANQSQGLAEDSAYTCSSHPVTRVTSKPDRKPASVAWRREVTLVRAPKNAATKLSAIATAMAAKNSLYTYSLRPSRGGPQQVPGPEPRRGPASGPCRPAAWCAALPVFRSSVLPTQARPFRSEAVGHCAGDDGRVS